MMEINRSYIQETLGIEKCNLTSNPLTRTTTITVDCLSKHTSEPALARMMIVLSPTRGEVALQDLIKGSWETRVKVCDVPWKVRSKRRLSILIKKNLAPHVKGLLGIFEIAEATLNQGK